MVSFDLSGSVNAITLRNLYNAQASRIVAVFLLHRATEQTAYVVLDGSETTPFGKECPFDHALPVFGGPALRRAFLETDFLDIETAAVCAAAGRGHTMSIDERLSVLTETTNTEWPRILRAIANSDKTAQIEDRVLAATIVNTPDHKLFTEFTPDQMNRAVVAECYSAATCASLGPWMAAEEARARLACVVRKVAWLRERIAHADSQSAVSES